MRKDLCYTPTEIELEEREEKNPPKGKVTTLCISFGTLSATRGMLGEGGGGEVCPARKRVGVFLQTFKDIRLSIFVWSLSTRSERGGKGGKERRECVSRTGLLAPLRLSLDWGGGGNVQGIVGCRALFYRFPLW